MPRSGGCPRPPGEDRLACDRLQLDRWSRGRALGGAMFNQVQERRCRLQTAPKAIVGLRPRHHRQPPRISSFALRGDDPWARPQHAVWLSFDQASREASRMSEFDPPAQLAALFDRVPDSPVKADFWFDWGPIFYRGRLDGSARVLCLASDPGPTERIAGRALVGNAGQRVQGLLAKLGLTRSYVCLNAWAYAVHPSKAQAEQQRLDDP